MKERPILFSGPMVQAILDGRKTQTRRIVNPQPFHYEGEPCQWYNPTKIDRHGEEYPSEEVFGFFDEETGWPCKYGGPGDRLWVKETFMPMPHLNAKAFYRASDGLVGGKWKPSIFMPRNLSRITLEIAEVRVERLNDISEVDILSEGVTVDKVAQWCNVPWSSLPTLHHAFQCLWNSINGEASWDLNPWVWVLTFKRIQP